MVSKQHVSLVYVVNVLYFGEPNFFVIRDSGSGTGSFYARLQVNAILTKKQKEEKQR